MNTKIDIISGFLGAGKTTLIKKLLKESLSNEQIVLIENEFGEIGIDGGFLSDTNIQINEMNSGCICCSLVGDFEIALKEVLDTYHPDRIIIEPSGVGKLSDVIKAVQDIHDESIVLNSFITVVDAKKCRVYAKNFGEFFNNQIAFASTIILSRTQELNETKINECISIIKGQNTSATITTTPWDNLSGDTILQTLESKETLEEILLKEDVCPICGHHHDEHEHHHHDHDHKHHHEHGHHHHDHDHGHHHHEHHHEHGHHHDHDHHHADEVFTSIGIETIHQYSKAELETILKELDNESKYGHILRCKGIVDSVEDEWFYFDYVPEEIEIRNGKADVTGRIVVIGEDIKEDELRKLFAV